ncbi:hypothetical protein GGR54DRAFT_207757 [Hypoxylon sp. NC1633]|nr:hypothetical protein GGR54DRAFT_207757 [Hypoxylon sp. NC1633]
MTEVDSSHSSSSSASPPTPNDRTSLPTTSSSTTLTTAPANQTKSKAQPEMAASSHNDREVAVSSATAARPNPISTSERHPLNDPFSSIASTARQRKRAHSIDIEEANQPRIQDLRLCTPSTAKSITSEGPRELICLCTKAPKVPRPRNAFILYRQHYQGQVAALHPGLANPEISKLIGEQWREQPEEIKNNWKRLAEEEKIRHQRQYPDYRYQPRRGGKTASSRPLPATGEDPTHCPKCGGRYIATPRTPSTPFGAATPDLAKPGPNMAPYVTPNPRVIETDHLRRGSASSSMSLEGHDRRFTQPHLQHIDEDYAMMSPMGVGGPADVKRRRFNGPNIFVPRSPPMGYMSADPRYQRPSVSGQPMSATGYGSRPLPRPELQYYQAPSYPSHAHMQPPPRPSMQYQAATTPARPSASFDESLRLPPLQTQVPNSPAMNADAGATRGVSAASSTHGTSQGPVNGSGSMSTRQQPAQAQQQPQHVPPRWSFLLKLEVLRSISPPLKPPGPGGPAFETRGPLIAIEGAAPSILREVAAVVEKALSVSGEYAVKMWTDDARPQSSGGDVNGRNHSSSTNANTSTSTSIDKVKQQEAVEKESTSQPRRPGLANYIGRMLKWHKTSEDIVQYITTHPPPPRKPDVEAGGDGKQSPVSNFKTKLPVAVVADGYSLSVSDRYAAALHVGDAYRADDHWQWVATLWRGIVGADLTVYVKTVPEAELLQGGGGSSVEFANPAIVVLRVADGGGGGASVNKGAGVGTGVVDEKLERRLGFEIIEWVRSGSFGAGVR